VSCRPARPVAAVVAAAAVGSAGCGLNVQSPDLFQLTRVGAGQKLTLLVNDGGTVSCNGGASKSLPDPLLLRARDLATTLDGDAKSGRRFAGTGAGVYRYTVRLQDGMISFPDTAAARYPELAQTELLALQIANGPCGR
jgi:hypothetical protein